MSDSSGIISWPQVFIIDDRADYRELLSHHVSTHWSDARVKQYDPAVSGKLPSDFAGAGHDIVLLGNPGNNDTLLDSLRQFARVSRFPPVIVIGDGDERQIVAAIQSGATDYVSRQRLTHAHLIDIMEAVLGKGRPDSSTGRFYVPAEELEASGMPELRGYEFQRRIAVNEVSAVYLVRHEESGKSMVLKVLRHVPDFGGESAFDRFLQEFELIAKLDHPNIVKIFDLGVGDDHAFIAMEYCSKGTLKLRIKRGLDPARAFSLMRQMAGALGELHAAGIAHRDLKPTNIMFREDDTMALIDFGLAKQAKLKAEITGTGEIFGTPYYMSPEQGYADKVDERADIYSMGVIFYEMLTGQKPYDGDTAMAVIIQHQKSPIPQLPDELARFQPCIDRMMAKLTQDRFQTVEELMAWAPAEVDAAVVQSGRSV